MSDPNPDPTPESTDSDVIDLAPFLQRKRAKDCTHRNASIGDDVASISCDDCGSELDPWWYLRMIAAEHEVIAKAREADQAKFEKWLAEATAIQNRLIEDINHLVDTKNQLANERDPATGIPMGALAARRRRRRTAR